MSQSASQIQLLSAGKLPGRVLAFAAVPLLFAGLTASAGVSTNTGSLGAAANGTNAATVTSGPGAVAAGGDLAAVYNNTNGTNTTISNLAALNPAASSPFTIEFWAKPISSDNDDGVVSTRVTTAPRSGWTFFMRDAATGWNFRMYNGNGTDRGWDLTGGTATLNAYSHVVATWNGSTALLYVNGNLADSTNDTPATTHIGEYVPNTTGPLTIGTIDDQTSPFDGAVDEVAFYPTALSATQIANHFATASSPTPGAYYSLVQSDGALLQLSNVPEPSSLLLIGGGSLLLLRRRFAR